MNLLIVDDEKIVADNLLHEVNWKELGLELVWCAYNVLDAKAVFEKAQVDILLCDIEMPFGNGMDLLRWVREHEFDCECIFLTCHAEFNYAREALQLGSSDYLLKPVDYGILVPVIMKAMDRIADRQREKIYERYGHQWENNKDKMVSIFWRELLEGGAGLDLEEIGAKAAGLNLDIDIGMMYVVILFGIKYRSGPENESNIVSYGMESLAKRIFKKENMGFFKVSSVSAAMVVPAEDTGELVEKCYEFLNFSREAWGYQMAACVSEQKSVADLAQCFTDLINLDKNNVSAELMVYTSKKNRDGQDIYRRPNIVLWRGLMESAQYSRLMEEVRFYLGREKHLMGRHHLARFMQEFEQMAGQVLEERNIYIYENVDEKEEQIYLERCLSIENAMKYIECIFYKAGAAARDKGSVVEKIKEYVDIHMDKEVTREELAEYVYLNPDYLSKLFKKEAGISLKEYITGKKMEVACELLAMTDMSVSEIATRVGYYNFAHFSTVFRKTQGCTPMKYRQENAMDIYVTK